MNVTTHTIINFVAGAVFGALIASLWFLLPGAASPWNTVSTATTTKQEYGLPQDNSGRVSVRAQAAGNQAIVDSIDVPSPGVWVAIHEVNGTTLGNVLGAARARMPVENLEINLLRETLPGHPYAVVLYRDDGDDLFDHEADSVYVDFDTGEPVVSPFNTTE